MVRGKRHVGGLQDWDETSMNTVLIFFQCRLQEQKQVTG